jgi:hypothetical protein
MSLNEDHTGADAAESPVLQNPTIQLLHLRFNRLLSCPGVTDHIMDFLHDELARPRLEEIKESYDSSNTIANNNSINNNSHAQYSKEMYHERAGPVLQELANMMKGPFAANVFLLRQAFQVIFRILQSVPDLMIGVYQQDKHWQRNEAQAANWRIVFKQDILPVVLQILVQHSNTLRSECCSVLYRCFMFVFRADAREWNRVYIQALLEAHGDKVITGGRDCSLSAWTEQELKDTHCLLQKMIHVVKENPESAVARKLARLEKSNQRIVDCLRERKMNRLVSNNATR